MLFGKTDINIDAIKGIGEEAFRKMFTGKLDVDINEVCKLIFTESKSTMMTSTDGNVVKRKRNN